MSPLRPVSQLRRRFKCALRANARQEPHHNEPYSGIRMSQAILIIANSRTTLPTLSCWRSGSKPALTAGEACQFISELLSKEQKIPINVTSGRTRVARPRLGTGILLKFRVIEVRKSNVLVSSRCLRCVGNIGVSMGRPAPNAIKAFSDASIPPSK